MKYESIEHTTRNENGDVQIKLFHKVGILGRLIGLPQRVETYFERGINWYNKDNGKRVMPMKWLELEGIVEMINHLNENEHNTGEKQSKDL